MLLCFDTPEVDGPIRCGFLQEEIFIEKAKVGSCRRKNPKLRAASGSVRTNCSGAFGGFFGFG
jgi:hypothetical protein